MVSVERIRPNPWQPRSISDPVKMDELVRSIQAMGVLEPLLLRAVGESYELIAGDRRLRAAQRIGMKEVPAIIVELGDKESLEVALVENIQREDLNPVDEARAYNVLAEEFGTDTRRDRDSSWEGPEYRLELAASTEASTGGA